MRIRRLIPLLLFILPFLSPSVTHAANDGSPDPVALRLAIEDLIETFDDAYPDGESYLAELDALESEPDAPDFDAKLVALPVSYTHLDVYKRQVWLPRCCQ